MLALLLFLTPSFVQAQAPATVRGRVLLARETDSVPVPRLPVVLHRIGPAAQGPVDSVRTDALGRFRFRFPADTAALFLVSANYAGIEYFSPPAGRGEEAPDSVLLVVSDTSSAARVRMAARYLVIREPGADGSRRVLDLIILENATSRTRIGADSLEPSWVGRIPSAAANVQLGDADLSTQAMRVSGDSLYVYAPIAPGEKQLTLDYLLPGGADLTLPFASDSVATNVLTQEASARVLNPAMAAVDSQAIEGVVFQRWVGVPREGSTLRITFGAAPGAVPRWVLPALVAAAGLALIGAVILVRRRQPRPVESLDQLTSQIAQLDARYRGREADTPPDEWRDYQRRRGELETRLARRLAGTGTGQ